MIYVGTRHHAIYTRLYVQKILFTLIFSGLYFLLLGGLELFSCLLLMYYSNVFNQVFFLTVIFSGLYFLSVGLLFNTNKL